MFVDGFHFLKSNIVSSYIYAILDTHCIYHFSEVTIILSKLVKQLLSHGDQLLFHLMNKRFGHSMPPKKYALAPLDFLFNKDGDNLAESQAPCNDFCVNT